jgi:hypothetical protein
MILQLNILYILGRSYSYECPSHFQCSVLWQNTGVTRVHHMHWPVHAAAVFYLAFTQMKLHLIIQYTESVNWCRKLNCSSWLNLDYHSLIINLQHFLYQYQWPVTLSMSCHTSIQFLWYLIHNQGYLISCKHEEDFSNVRHQTLGEQMIYLMHEMFMWRKVKRFWLY